EAQRLGGGRDRRLARTHAAPWLARRARGRQAAPQGAAPPTQTDAVRVLAQGVSRPAGRRVSRQRAPRPGAWHMPCSAAHSVRRVRGAGCCGALVLVLVVVVAAAVWTARAEEDGPRARGAGEGPGS